MNTDESGHVVRGLFRRPGCEVERLRWAGEHVHGVPLAYPVKVEWGLSRSRITALWVAAFVMISLAAGAIYLTAQQTGRIGANDVPEAVSRLAAQSLGQGDVPVVVVGSAVVDLAARSSPFMIVFDSAHRVLATNATVAGAVPNVPTGVLDSAWQNGENRVTWQPMDGVREAVVAQPWRHGASSGVVVAGISLLPTEARSRSVLQLTILGWVIGLVLISAVLALASRRQPPPHPGRTS